MVAYQPAGRTGDVLRFGLDDPKAGALVLSTSLADFGSPTSTDPIAMFAARDAFRTVSEAIASGIASVPFNVYERNDELGRRKLTGSDDRVAAALESPYVGATQFRLVEALQLDMVLHDRWAVFLNENAAGELELLRLPARFVRFAIDGFRRVTDVVLKHPSGDKNRDAFIPPELCLFDYGYDPEAKAGETAGYPLSHTLRGSATELDKGMRFRELLLAGGPKVPMWIHRPAEAGDWIRNGGRARFLETFKAYGNEKAGEVPLLEDGMELRATPQLATKDINYAELRKAAQLEFCISLHYPPELIGYREGTLSNVEAYREQLYVDVLGGRITAFRQALNTGLRRAGLLEDDRYVEENLGARLASTPEKQASLLQTQVGAPVLTRNEARGLLNRSKVPGGDELITPMNVTVGGLASPTDTTGGRELLAREPRTKAIGPAAAAPTQQARFADALAAALRAQGTRVKAALGSDSSPGSLEEAWNRDLEDRALAAVIYAHAAQLAATGADDVLARYNPEGTGFKADAMLPWLSKAAGGIAHEINAGTEASLVRAMFSGEEWATGVAELFEQRASSGAQLWAATVATTALSFGANDAAVVSGCNRKSWRASAGDRHSALDGESVPIGSLFSNGSRYPGDPSLPPAEQAGCSCRVEYSLE